MSLSNERRVATWPQAFRRILFRDPWVAGTGLVLALLILIGARITDPSLAESEASPWLELLLVTGALMGLGAVHTCRHRSTYLNEKRFWNLVLPAQGALFLGQAISALESASVTLPMGLIDWGPDIFLGLFFVLMIPAVEIRPDRRRAEAPSRLDSLWLQPAAALFVGSLLLYFPGVAHWRKDSGDDIDQQALLLFSTLCAFLGGRFMLFALESPSARWRLQYTVLSAAFLTLLAAELILIFAPQNAAFKSAGLTAVAVGCLVVAAGLNRLTFAGSRSRKPGSPAHLDLTGIHRSTTLLWTLTLPFLHVLLHRLGMLPEANRDSRELLVLITVTVLGGYAIAQRYWVELETLDLWQSQRNMAEQLQSSEQDLRILVERQRGFRELEQSEKKFSMAFQLSPDAMLISTVREGRVLDVNRSFCHLFGGRPDELIGRTTEDIGFFDDESRRDEILRETFLGGAVRELPWTLNGPEGPQSVQASFELIYTGNDRLLLTVLGKPDGTQARVTEPLSPLTAAVFATDRRGNLSYWSPSSEDLYGWDEPEAFEHETSTLRLPSPAVNDPKRSSTKPLYRCRVTNRDGVPLRLTCHSAQLTDEAGEPRGWLTFASASQRDPRRRPKTPRC